MRIIHKYMTLSFLTTFLMTLFVFTFVMSIGIVFKVTDLLALGVSWKPILRILMSGLPTAMSFSIPISVLTACLLLFGRLSADGEITAMRACGIGLRQVIAGPLVVSLQVVQQKRR